MEQFSQFMTVKDDRVILDNNVMINSKGQLIYNNGDRVMKQDTNDPLPSFPFNSILNFTEETATVEENMEVGELPYDWGGMLCLPNVTFCIVSMDTSEILIRKLYLQMIEKLESDTEKGCVIVGIPGIGKTFFGLFYLFYLTRLHPQSRIIWETFDITWYVFLPSLRVESGMLRQVDYFSMTIFDKDAFYLTDSKIPMSNAFAYTLLFSSPRQERWNEFIKKDGVSLFYAPIWTSDEIWILWREHWKKKMTADRVQELLDR